MGKLRRPRQKFHTRPKKSPNDAPTRTNTKDELPPLVLQQPPENLFAGIDINPFTLKNKLDTDTVSVRSFKSAKSERHGEKSMTKKEKLKLRRELLMQKVDTVNQLKKQAKQRKRREKVAVVGDLNPLHDALPSLESLLKVKKEKLEKAQKPRKPRAVEKSSRRKNNLVRNVNMFKMLMKGKDLSRDSLTVAAEHIKQKIKEKI